RLHGTADRPSESGQLLGPGPDVGPAGAGSAAQGYPQRPYRPPEADTGQSDQSGHQATLVLEHAGYQSSHLRQYRGPRAQRHRRVVVIVLDRGAVRSEPELEGSGMDQETL